MTGRELFSEIIILTLPHSGSTAMARLLLSSPRVWARMPGAEGQKLAASKPFLPANPWRTDQQIDWSSLRAIWEEGRPEGAILLEKSPPLVAHLPAVIQTWPNAYFVITIRNPYAFVASYLQRGPPTDQDVESAVWRWTKRSQLQRRNVEALVGRSIVTSYEAFTRQPDEFVRSLETVVGPLDIDPTQDFTVKLYKPAPISNHNDRQISTMSESHRALAGRLLATQAADELAFWGY